MPAMGRCAVRSTLFALRTCTPYTHHPSLFPSTKSIPRPTRPCKGVLDQAPRPEIAVCFYRKQSMRCIRSPRQRIGSKRTLQTEGKRDTHEASLVKPIAGMIAGFSNTYTASPFRSASSFYTRPAHVRLTRSLCASAPGANGTCRGPVPDPAFSAHCPRGPMGDHCPAVSPCPAVLCVPKAPRRALPWASPRDCARRIRQTRKRKEYSRQAAKPPRAPPVAQSSIPDDLRNLRNPLGVPSDCEHLL